MPQPVTLSVWTEDGQKHDFVLGGPGGTARVCIGDANGDHSAIWRVWASRNTSDVYIAVRDISGTQKFSLHESGDWRHQYLTPEIAERFTSARNRIMDQWPQPSEDPNIRMTLGFSIRARRQDLANYPERKGFPESLIWVPPPSVDKAMVIHVVIGRLHDQPVNLGGMVPFYGFALADGRVVLLLAHVQDVPATVNDQIDALIGALADRDDVRRAKRPRIALYGNSEHGRFAWDIALRPEAAA